LADGNGLIPVVLAIFETSKPTFLDEVAVNGAELMGKGKSWMPDGGLFKSSVSRFPSVGDAGTITDE
jgi:hypothetical protein